MILQIDGCLDVINRILINLSDNDLLNLCRASPKLEDLFNLPSAHWRRRLERYNTSLVERFLKHTGHVVNSLHSYCEFITELNKCITCESKPSLSVDYTSGSLARGPGTLQISPDIQFSETLCHFYRALPFDIEPDEDGFMPLFAQPNLEEEQVIMRMDRNHSEIEIDGELLKINENYDQNLPNGMFDPENFEPTRVCLFDERLIVWQPGLLNDSRVFMIGPGQVLFKIVDLSSKEEITHLSDDYLQNVHIRVVDDFIVLTATVVDRDNQEVPNNRPLLRVYKVENYEIIKLAEFDRLRDVLNPSLHEAQSFTMLSGGYVLFMNSKNIEMFNVNDQTTKSLNMKKIIDASYLKSSILTQKYAEVNRSEPEVRWLPIKTRPECTVEATPPLFLLVFGCRNYSSNQGFNKTFRGCRSAAYATFVNGNWNKLKLEYIPCVSGKMDIIVHDGFIQVHSKCAKTQLGTFYKFVRDIRGINKIVKVKLNLANYFPNQGHTNYNHQIRGRATDDRIMILLRLWPLRSSASISVTHKILSFSFIPDVFGIDGEDTDSDDSDSSFQINSD